MSWKKIRDKKTKKMGRKYGGEERNNDSEEGFRDDDDNPRSDAGKSGRILVIRR